MSMVIVLQTCKHPVSPGDDLYSSGLAGQIKNSDPYRLRQ